MKWKTSNTASQNASAKLPKLAEKYFAAGRKAADGHHSARQLHRFRIRTKEFRYALELFRPVYGPTLDRHLKALRGIQDALGKINDYQSIEELVGDDKALVAKLQTARKRKMRQFRQEWKRFDSDGELKRWKDYLATRAAARQPKKSVAKAAAPAKKTAASAEAS